MINPIYIIRSLVKDIDIAIDEESFTLAESYCCEHEILLDENYDTTGKIIDVIQKILVLFKGALMYSIDRGLVLWNDGGYWENTMCAKQVILDCQEHTEFVRRNQL